MTAFQTDDIDSMIQRSRARKAKDPDAMIAAARARKSQVLPSGENPLSSNVPARVSFNPPVQPGMAEAVAQAEPARRGQAPLSYLAGQAATGGVADKLALGTRLRQMSTPPADRSMAGEIGSQLIGGGLDTMQSRAGLLGSVGGALQGVVGENPVSGALEDARRVLVEGLEFAKVPVQPSQGPLYGARSIVGNVFRAAPQFGEQVGLGMIPGGTAAQVGVFTLAGAGPVIGQVYNDAMAQHGNQGQAAGEALAAGYATAFTSMFPGFAIFSKTPAGAASLRAAIMRHAGAVGSAAVAEGGQEMSESILHEAIKGAIRQDPDTYTPEFWKGLGMEGLVGAIMGGGAHSAMIPFHGSEAGPAVDAMPEDTRAEQYAAGLGMEAADFENAAAAAERSRGIPAPALSQTVATADPRGGPPIVDPIPTAAPASYAEVQSAASLMIKDDPDLAPLKGPDQREIAQAVAKKLRGQQGVGRGQIAAALEEEKAARASSLEQASEPLAAPGGEVETPVGVEPRGDLPTDGAIRADEPIGDRSADGAIRADEPIGIPDVAAPDVVAPLEPSGDVAPESRPVGESADGLDRPVGVPSDEHAGETKLIEEGTRDDGKGAEDGAVAAHAESLPDPKRAETIERIVKAARNPALEVVEVKEYKGNNGKWYGVHGVPFGVTLTDEKRTVGFAYRARDNGTIVGKTHPTREAAERAQQERLDAVDADFRGHLEKMDDEAMAGQVSYWLKENAPLAATVPDSSESEPAPIVKSDAAPTYEEWVAKVRFYRSGKTKNAQLPSGERVILTNESTATNFREKSRKFLERLYQRESKRAAAKPAPAAPAPAPKPAGGQSAAGGNMYAGGKSILINGMAGGELMTEAQRIHDAYDDPKTKAAAVEIFQAVNEGRMSHEFAKDRLAEIEETGKRRQSAMDAPKPKPLPDTDSGATITPEPKRDEVPDQARPPERDGAGSKPVLLGEAGVAPGTTEAAGVDPGEGGQAQPSDGAADGGEPGGAGDGGGAAPRPARGRGTGKRDGGGRSRRPKAEPAADVDGNTPEPGPVETGPRVQDVARNRPADVSDRNHRIAAGEVIAPNGVVGKIKANIKAIELLRVLESEDRNATPEEKKTLAQYAGWGPISQALDRIKGRLWEEHLEQKARGYGYPPSDEVTKWAEKYYDYYKRIRELVTRDEFEGMTHSTRNAHFTSKDVIERGIWPTVQQLGFTGGNILETSAGIGHMIGLTPDALEGNSRWTAVEINSLSARMLRKLYPEAAVLHSPFQTAALKRNSFDLIVGNVPFAADKIDTDEGYPKFSLHNYFLAKSIDMLRPGGLMVAISSTSSMDSAASRAWRIWAAERADLVGAIRLPNNAFVQSANTSVTTDILIFRKKGTGGFALAQPFVNAKELSVGKDTVEISEYFHEHPEMMLGKMSAEGTMYGRDAEPTLEPTPGDLGEKLDKAVKALPAGIANADAAALETAADEAPSDARLYAIYLDKGKPKQRLPGGEVAEFTGAQTKRAVAYVGLRESYTELVKLQVHPEASEKVIERSRAVLKSQYEDYTKAHGYLNDAKSAILRDDPDFNKVAALEVVKRVPKVVGTRKDGRPKIKAENQITPAAILTKRTQFPFHEPTKADNIADAAAISESFRGGLNVAYVASMLSIPEPEAKRQLLDQGVAFLDPATGQLQSRSQYLSGNIRDKLALATKAAETDEGMAPNVAALKAVMPEPVSISKISMKLGATWVPAESYEAWAESIFGEGALSIERAPVTGTLIATTGYPQTSEGRANIVSMGTNRMMAHEIVRRVLTNGQLTIYDKETDEHGNDKQVVNTEATIAVKDAATRLGDAFVSWAKSGEHATRIADQYNATFNGTVPREYEAPKFKHFPGAATDVELREYQKRAVVRGVAGSYLNAHEVGLGKTFTGITTAMEWRRLGLAKKPMIVVQNATVGQFAASFNRLYPAANVLVPTEKDMEKQYRGRLLNRIVTGDWDAVVIPQSMWNRIELSGDYARGFIESQLDELETALANAIRTQGKKSPTVKNLQKRIDSLRERLAKLLASAKDPSVMRLDEMGVDGIIIDEAHAYKKTFFFTELENVRGLDTDFSKRGLDMFLKVRYVQERTGNRNVMLMSGTPITNTMAEAWTMMRYVRPDVLAASGISNFDDFVTAFGEISTREEMDATNRYKAITRLRRFVNIPELQAIWRECADVVRAADSGEIVRPPIKGGKPTIIEIEPGKATIRYMRALLAEYAAWEKLKGREKREQAHVPLTIMTRARKAATDLRLVDSAMPDDPASKLNRCIEETFKRWEEGKEDKLTQVIFLDMYQTEGFNAFAEIRKKLVAKGVPADEIALITEYEKDVERAALFERVNRGDVRVIMGTTERLGVGVNMQERLGALHHMDAPWRPSDMEQREGRMIRQGNLVVELTGDGGEIIRYGVKKSFDAGAFERLARKQQMIMDVIAGKSKVREVEDLSEDAIANYAEAAAAFSGDPDVLRKAELDTEIRQLEAVRSAHQDALEGTRRRIERLLADEKSYTIAAERAARFVKNIGARFADVKAAEVSVGGKVATGDDARKALQEYVKGGIEALRAKTEDAAVSPRVSMQLSPLVVQGVDFKVKAQGEFNADGAWDSEAAGVTFTATVQDVTIEPLFGRRYKSGDGLLNAIFDAASGMENSAAVNTSVAKRSADDAATLKTTLGKKFDRQEQLDKLIAERDAVMERLRGKAKADEEQDVGGAPPVEIEPERSSSGLEARLTRIIEGAQRRLRESRLPRGRNVGGTTLATDIANTAIIAAFKAVRAGVRAGKRLTKIVAEVLKDHPNVAEHAARVRKVAKALIEDAGGTAAGLEKAAETLHADFERIRANKRARLLRRTEVEKGTGVRKPVDPKFIELRRKYGKAEKLTGQGYRAGVKDAPAPEPMSTKEQIEQATGVKREPRMVTEQQALRGSMSSAARAAIQGARLGRKEAAAEARLRLNDIRRQWRAKAATDNDIRSHLIGVIEELLPQARRGELLTMIRDTDTWQKLARAFVRIDRVVKDEQRRVAIAEYKRVVRRLNPKKMNPQYRDMLNAAIGDISATTMSEKRRKSLMAMVNHAATNPGSSIPPWTLDAARSALAKRGLRGMTTAEIEALTQLVQHIKHLNKTLNKIRFGRQVRDFDTLASEASARIDAAPSIADSRAARLLLRRKDPRKDPTKNLLATEAEEQLDRETMAMAMDGSREGPWTTVLVDDAIESERNARRWQQRGLEALHAAMDAAGLKPGSKAAAAWFQERVVAKLHGGETLDLTRDERIDLYLMLTESETPKEIDSAGLKLAGAESKDRVSGNYRNQVAFLASIDPKERAIAEALSDFINKPLKQAANRVWVQLVGYEHLNNPRYWTRRRDGTEAQKDASEGLRSYQSAYLETLSIFKGREDNSKPILIEGVLEKYNRVLVGTAEMIGKGQHLRTMGMMLGNPGIQRSVRKTLGTQRLNTLRTLLQEFSILGQRNESTLSRRIGKISGNVGKSVLGLNIFSAVSQATGPAIVAARRIVNNDFDPKHFATAAAGMANPAQWVRVWGLVRDHAPILRDRYEGSITKLITPEFGDDHHMLGQAGLMQRIAESKGRALLDPRTYRDFGLLPLEYMDFANTVFSWLLAEAHGKAKGLTGVDLTKYAADVADREIGATQNVANNVYANPFTLSARTNALARLRVMFQSFWSKMANLVVQSELAARQAKGPKAKAAARARQLAALSLVAMATAGWDWLLQELRHMGDDDEERKKRGLLAEGAWRLAKTASRAIPGLDKFVSMVEAFNQRPYSATSAARGVDPVTSTYMDLATTTASVLKEMGDGEPAESAKVYRNTMGIIESGSRIGGFPFGAVRRWLIDPVLEPQ